MEGFNICRAGNAVRNTLDKIHKEIDALSREIDSTERAYRPHDETRATLIASIKDAQYWKTVENQFESFQSPFYRVWELPCELSLAHLAYLMGPEGLADRIMERIRANGMPVGLSASEREKKVAEIKAKLQRLLESEEIETMRIEKLGWVVLRREDADPQVLFCVWAQRDA